MRNLCRQRLDRLRRERDALLADLMTWPREALRERPGPGAWSATEVVEHLVLAEREILQGLADPGKLAARRRRLWHRVRYGFVVLVLRLNIRVPVISVEMEPRGERMLAAWIKLWDETLGWLEGYLQTVACAGWRRAVFSHPVAGPLDLGQALALARLHLRAHRRQIERNRKRFVSRA